MVDRDDAEKDLNRLRDAIDRVDEVLVQLLNQRAKYAWRSARSRASSASRSTSPTARSEKTVVNARGVKIGGHDVTCSRA